MKNTLRIFFIIYGQILIFTAIGILNFAFSQIIPWTYLSNYQDTEKYLIILALNIIAFVVSLKLIRINTEFNLTDSSFRLVRWLRPLWNVGIAFFLYFNCSIIYNETTKIIKNNLQSLNQESEQENSDLLSLVFEKTNLVKELYSGEKTEIINNYLATSGDEYFDGSFGITLKPEYGYKERIANEDNIFHYLQVSNLIEPNFYEFKTGSSRNPIVKAVDFRITRKGNDFISKNKKNKSESYFFFTIGRYKVKSIDSIESIGYTTRVSSENGERIEEPIFRVVAQLAFIPDEWVTPLYKSNDYKIKMLLSYFEDAQSNKYVFHMSADDRDYPGKYSITDTGTGYRLCKDGKKLIQCPEMNRDHALDMTY